MGRRLWRERGSYCVEGDCYDGEISRHGFAAFGMMFGWEMVGRGWVPGMCEDTERGGDGSEIPRGTRNDICFKRRGWVPACARTREGGAGTGGSRTVSAGENVVGNGVHPHPNLPPSRGKGFVGALLQLDSTAGLCCVRNDVWGEGLTALRKQRTRGG